MIVNALNLPEAPFLVCSECAAPVTDETLEENMPCGHVVETYRVCMTWAMSTDCRCATAFHDTVRVKSTNLPWLAALVLWHIERARGDKIWRDEDV